MLVTEVKGEYKGDNIDSVHDSSCLKLTDFTWIENERSQEKYFYNYVHELFAAKARLQNRNTSLINVFPKFNFQLYAGFLLYPFS